MYRQGVGHRQVCGQIAHAVAGRADGHGAAGGCARGAVGGGAGVESVGDRAGPVGDLLVAESGQPALVGAQFGVQGAAVSWAQSHRFGDDQAGAVLGEHPGLQCGEGVRHVVHQRRREGEVLTTALGGIVAGQPDLGAEPAAASGGGHAAGGLGGSALWHRVRP